MEDALKPPGSKLTEAPTSCSLTFLSKMYPEIVEAKDEEMENRQIKQATVSFIKGIFRKETDRNLDKF